MLNAVEWIVHFRLLVPYKFNVGCVTWYGVDPRDVMELSLLILAVFLGKSRRVKSVMIHCWDCLSVTS